MKQIYFINDAWFKNSNLALFIHLCVCLHQTSNQTVELSFAPMRSDGLQDWCQNTVSSQKLRLEIQLRVQSTFFPSTAIEGIGAF